MTADDDHDRLIRVEQNVLEMKDSLNKVLPDHETRIRSLEKWKYGIPAGLVLTFFTGLTAVVHH